MAAVSGTQATGRFLEWRLDEALGRRDGIVSVINGVEDRARGLQAAKDALPAAAVRERNELGIALIVLEYKVYALWTDLYGVRGIIERTVAAYRTQHGAGAQMPGYRPEPPIRGYLSKSAGAATASLPMAVRLAIGTHVEPFALDSTSA